MVAQENGVDLIGGYLAGDVPGTVLARSSGTVVRLEPPFSSPVVLKLWQHRGLKAQVRRAFRTDSVSRETRYDASLSPGTPGATPGTGGHSERPPASRRAIALRPLTHKTSIP